MWHIFTETLLVKKTKTGGRNNSGKMTVRHIGGGAKQKYRIIDFKRNKTGVTGKVVSIEYDPNRNANIALISYKDGEKKYTDIASIQTALDKASQNVYDAIYTLAG